MITHDGCTARDTSSINMRISSSIRLSTRYTEDRPVLSSVRQGSFDINSQVFFESRHTVLVKQVSIPQTLSSHNVWILSLIK